MTKGKESNLHTIKDVTFYYSSVSHPHKNLNKDNKPPRSEHPLELHSHEIKIALDEKRYKAFKKKFKGAHNLVYTKEMDPQEFMEFAHTEVEPESDMYIIKFAQPCLSGRDDNRKLSRPIVQIGVVGRVQDRQGNTIDADTSIGNGTKGHFQFRRAELSEMVYLYPVAVCITDLVKYEGGAVSADEEAFGVEEMEEVDPDARIEEPVTDDFDDDIDF